MKYIIILITLSTLTSCTSSDQEKLAADYSRQIKILNEDTIINITKQDTLVFSYMIRNNKPNGVFQSHIHGKLFSQGLMVDSLKTNVWKYYNLETSQIDSVSHYFNDKRVFLLDKNDFIFKTVKVSSSDIEIKVPVDWTIKEKYEGTIFAIVKKAKENGFRPNITLVLEKNEIRSFDKYCENAMSLLLTQYSNSEIIESRNMIIDGCDAKQYIFTGNISDHNLGNIVLIINHPNGNYTYIAGADNNSNGNFLKYKGLFEEILYSSKISRTKI